MSKQTLTVIANMARRKCPNERLAHQVADTIERSADIASAARDVQAMFGRHQPSATLAIVADLLFDEAKLPRPANPNAFHVSTANPAEASRTAEDDYRARRTAEIRSYGKRPPVGL